MTTYICSLHENVAPEGYHPKIEGTSLYQRSDGTFYIIAEGCPASKTTIPKEKADRFIEKNREYGQCRWCGGPAEAHGKGLCVSGWTNCMGKTSARDHL